MANSDKDILITPNTSTGSAPKIEFVGADATYGTDRTITLNAVSADSGTISFLNGAGDEVFSINNFSSSLQVLPATIQILDLINCSIYFTLFILFLMSITLSNLESPVTEEFLNPFFFKMFIEFSSITKKWEKAFSVFLNHLP